MRFQEKNDLLSYLIMLQKLPKWVEIFNKFDKNRDGKISFKELKKRIKEYNSEIPASTIRSILKKADTDEDGVLDLNEFLALVKSSREARGLFSNSLDKWVQTVCVVPKKGICAEYTGDVTDAEIEYEEHYSCCPPPLFMIIITVLELFAYIYDSIDQKPGQPSTTTILASLFIYNPHRRAEAWRYLTYMFVHIGIFHLLVNLLVQIMLGIPLEMVHHWWRVLFVYLAGVVAGSLATSVSDPSIYLAGASGGVYAIMAAHVASIIMNWTEKRFAWVQLLIFIILAITDVGTAIYNRYILDVNDQVGYVAHLAGAVAGLLVGINVLRNFRVRTWEKTLRWFSFFFYSVLMLIAIIWNAAFPSYFPKQRV
ncbi:conserved hypothetical protein [Pediculus humanus corporis]|uniref:rhomboid protease n=1 Tax=Pediculus humanus subsp. corporis TaxID=121224 RepID=E0VJ88_PEDHC|nr:uncharacterized protein Phum_PHUM240580 [Pediculus humanus corporis]EEB13444.1 conserved hypothetical protein [Pediculus humanus corporis]